jgi:Uma2 family endonuclease
MTAPTSIIPKYTYQDYKNWKEDWELIDGYPWSLMPAAGWNHNVTQSNAVFQGKKSLLSNSNCNCWIVSKLDWKINNDTILRPDMMIICNKPKNDFLEFPPALIMEILSASTHTKDRTIKFQIYQEQGVKYYLMADCDRRIVQVYELIDNLFREVKKNTFLLENNCEVSFDFDRFWD